MSWLSRISVANRKLVALVTLLLVVLGAYSAKSLKQQLLPDLSFPAVTVVGTHEGASPEIVEKQVTEPIEDAVKSVDGVESMTSTSRQGSTTVSVQFDYDADIDDASNKVQQALSRISAQLPQGVDPQVNTGSTDSQPTITLAATSDASQHDLAQALDDDVVPALKDVDGVNDVTVSGERDQVVSIVPDADALKKAGLTTQSISDAVAGLGTSPAGSLDEGKDSVSVSVPHSVASVKDIGNLWLSSASTGTGSGATAGSGAATGMGGASTGGTSTASPVQLKDVAEVKLTEATATSLTRTDGKASLGVAVTMDHNGSSASISDDVRAQIADLEHKLGHNARLTVVSDSGPQVSKSVSGLFEEGLLGLLMAVLVIVLFLRSARSTLVTAVSIPLSLLIALTALWIGDYSLNVLTLGGLTIAVGRVVDDSIVVLENIKRHLGYGEDKRRAVLGAVREVSSAVTASTLTTVAVFLPVAFVSGMVGELFGPFAVTVVVAMAASLLVALTLVPALAYWFLKPPADAIGADPDEYRARVEAEERHGFLQRVYLPVINWSVRRRRTVLSAAVALFVITVAMVGTLKTSFLGDSGSTSLNVTQTMPAGSSLSATDAAAKKAESVIKDIDGVASYQVTVGSSSAGFSGSTSNASSASYTVVTDSEDVTDRVQDTLRDRLDALHGAGTFTLAAGGGVGSDSDVEVVVHADDDATLRTATKSVESALKKLDSLSEVTSDLSEESPQITVAPKGEKSAELGLTAASLAQSVGQALQGTTAGQVTLDGRQDDVVVHGTDDRPTSLGTLRDLDITVGGETVRLGDVATVSRTEAPVERTRTDGERTNTVSATPAGDDTGTASTDVRSALDALDLPSGASYTMGGVTSEQSEAFGQLALAIAAAIALVFLLLIATFRSVRQTLVLLVSIPFAATGAIGLLAVTGTPLGIAALIGLLMLIGIVVTNAVVLLDLVNQYRRQGMSVHDAVVEGGLRRLRPIVMTALATIFALLPMALGITGSSGFISQPLAVVVIGGLLSSTLLTLVLIPTLYTMVETRRERRQARKDRRRTPEAPRPAEPEPVLS
ncbi:efflux RND transporter permease subunit [Streptomyces mangrovisoli]|uniref:Hydrogenase expression protein n=1 Tax=Streptomyces mangrovisoli TaxID=1428628 RepID=A0A1J4NVY5_9ACTN|nr:efflux RND transporter permease subunit [Streptomyces mangrovisoli]OIJ65389.1 hydrogenase expression protein [Streptomyces mangrovisoli]